MSNLSQLTKEALSLPLDDRVRLAQELWASLQPAPGSMTAGGEETEALDLAENRDADLESGSVKGVPNTEAMAKARKSL